MITSSCQFPLELDGLWLAAHLLETAGGVAADRPLVVGEHPQRDVLQAERSEGVLERQPHRLASQSAAELGGIVEPDRQPGVASRAVDVVEAEFAQEAPVVLHHARRWDAAPAARSSRAPPPA